MLQVYGCEADVAAVAAACTLAMTLVCASIVGGEQRSVSDKTATRRKMKVDAVGESLGDVDDLQGRILRNESGKFEEQVGGLWRGRADKTSL